jgi:SAM-dependent methyltransferase
MPESPSGIRSAGKAPLQTRFPLLWLAVQYAIAGFFDRGRHILKHFRGQKRVLEVGCSVGIDSIHFAGKPCEYLGIDIDPEAVRHARGRFKDRAHMSFKACDLRLLDPARQRFDFILLCGTIHHIPEEELRPILEHAARLLDDSGLLVVIDYALHDQPGVLERLILRLEEGAHIRDRESLLASLSHLEGLEVQSVEVFKNAAFLLPWPVMAHKFLIVLRKGNQPSGLDQKGS